MPLFDDERDLDASRDLPSPSVSGAASAYETLLGAIDRVIAEWRELVVTEPWAHLPASRLVDAFPEIVPKMLRLSRAGVTHVDDSLRELIADAHGHFRRIDGVPLTAVAEEWAHLKRACRRVLDSHGVSAAEADRAMERLDSLVDDAVGYTLRGYYAPELDSLRGRGLERREISDRRRGIPDRRERGED
ncbi:MAG: hypothetical protein ACT4PJ_17325 [Gemmatimonadaceae bacterium]